MRAIFCGNGSLLIQCADMFSKAGGQIAGVLSSDARIIAWADDQQIRHLGAPDEAGSVPDMPFDYLFSVANLTVLPAAFVNRARSINFHDGPLPERAGLNAPAWAIIEGQKSHAITWHEMTEKVDAGRVLKVRSFEILPTDTAFSLNARCYEAGLESFAELLADLIAGRETPLPMQGTRGWYGRTKRPDGLGLLDFTTASTELDRLVRGLDFGAYSNPLCVAKILTPIGVLVMRRLEIGTETHQAPGRVLALAADSMTIAAGDAEVRVSGLTDLAGTPVDPAALGPMLGHSLVLPVPIPAADLAAVGRSEAEWDAALAHAASALPPYPMKHRRESGTASAALQLATRDCDAIAAAWLGWTAGLSGTTRASLALQTGSPHPALSPLRLVTLDITADATPSALTSAMAEARLRAQARAPMAADLPLRMPDAEARQTAQRALSVVITASAGAEMPEGALLAIQTEQSRLVGTRGVWDEATLAAMAAAFSAFLAAFMAEPDRRVADLSLTDTPALGRIGEPYPQDQRLHHAVTATAHMHPDAVALEAGTETLSYAELEQRADALALVLSARGAAPGMIIGLCLERSAGLVVAMLAILKTGAAYLPLDPAYPADRLGFMITDAGASLIVASRTAAARLRFDTAITVFPDASGTGVLADNGTSNDLAYLIYTSGSTGKPKGVMIPHRAVMNFMAGMDRVVPLTPGARLLAVTSVSFDISVLEIFWTLSRGATLVLQTDAAGEVPVPEFSLFYFASEAAGTGHHAYRLLLEGARFADENGFAAIWTPERHFHAFGGLYPNPAVSSAALAGITKNVKLRAGSSVAPLHHPVRVAEDWALVDNLSNGRAGIAIASGWQPNDFIVRPEAFADRKDRMLDAVTTLRKLWRGEKMAFPGPDGKLVEVEIHPKPMQADFPLWLTAAGNPETFAAAARLGCGVLTHLLGQGFDELSEKISAYRIAWREAGHPGDGHVVLMLHTFIGDTEGMVRDTARVPMKGYLKSAVDLVRRASWTFPTIVQRATAQGMTPQEMFEKEELSAEDLDQLLDHAFERYYRTSGLFGTSDTAREIVRRVAGIGVNEIACLIDFGIDTDVALTNLPNIKALMVALEQDGQVTRKVSVAEEIVEKRITHLQCTPSMAAMLAADAPGRAALARLQVMMVGGEAFPVDLAKAIRAAMPGVLLNMYGPTETTIWSSVARLDAVGASVPLGIPILNTVLGVHSASGRALPDLVEGELWIGGAGVARGYWNRPDLTDERFVETAQGRFYRTGDLVRRNPDGTLDFLGRIDNQVKIRGHRIELGEIEAVLASDPNVRQAVVRAVEFTPGDIRLVGYVTPATARPDPAGLRAGLADILPEIMVPSQIVVLDRMPMTPNGKIDRKALAAPTAVANQARVAAEGDTEALIAEIWRDALGLVEVSVTDNFFDLGGHSLLVVQVQRRMKERLQRDIAITDLFRFSTIRTLAAYLSAQGGSADEDTPNAASRGVARAAARLARLGRR